MGWIEKSTPRKRKAPRQTYALGRKNRGTTQFRIAREQHAPTVFPHSLLTRDSRRGLMGRQICPLFFAITTRLPSPFRITDSHQPSALLISYGATPPRGTLYCNTILSTCQHLQNIFQNIRKYPYGHTSWSVPPYRGDRQRKASGSSDKQSRPHS